MNPTPKRMKRAGAVLEKTEYQGLEIHLDRPKGFERILKRGPDAGKVQKYRYDYGFFPGTKDTDGEELDVFLGPVPDSQKVFVIHQIKADGSFDEHKVMLGFDFEADALRAYTDHNPVALFGKVETLSFERFKERFLKGKVSHWENSMQNRVVSRYLSRQANTLKDILVDLKDLDLLATNIEKVTEAFGRNYKLAAGMDPQVMSQFDTLNKARKGLEAAKAIRENAKAVLAAYPEDKTAARAVKDAETMVNRFVKLANDTQKMVQTLSKKQMPEALKKIAAACEKALKAKLEDPKLLQSIPWQQEKDNWDSRTRIPGVEFQVVFRIAHPTIPNHLKKAEVILAQHTLGNGNPYVVEGYSLSKEPVTTAGFVARFVEQLQGWEGLKGQADANKDRAAVTPRIQRAIDSVTSQMARHGDRDRSTVNNMMIEGAFRQERLESYSEWQRDEIQDKVRKEAEAALKKAIGTDMKSVKSIAVYYSEKGWYNITVVLK